MTYVKLLYSLIIKCSHAICIIHKRWKHVFFDGISLEYRSNAYEVQEGWEKGSNYIITKTPRKMCSIFHVQKPNYSVNIMGCINNDKDPRISQRSILSKLF